jgi:hypothetical protein
LLAAIAVTGFVMMAGVYVMAAAVDGVRRRRTGRAQPAE